MANSTPHSMAVFLGHITLRMAQHGTHLTLTRATECWDRFLRRKSNFVPYIVSLFQVQALPLPGGG